MSEDRIAVDITVAIDPKTEQVHLMFGPLDPGDLVALVRHIATNAEDFEGRLLDHVAHGLANL